ncbi:hypothetical protein [Streptomyces mirabilis]|uniref:hypothetical protein n=1 Tax=Streptomyces mirabilis TaxID=68239 RepID=UPI0035E09119
MDIKALAEYLGHSDPGQLRRHGGSKVLATQVPARILDGVLQEDAEAAVAALRDVGAQAEVRAQPEPEFVKA